MKKKKGWLACVLFLLGALMSALCKKDKHKKQTVYKFSFHLQDKDTGTQVVSTGDASQKIFARFHDAGCCAAEYKSYALQATICTDNRDTLVFAVILPPEKKARTLLDVIKGELNLAHAWYIKEEYTYQELKKQLK